MSRVNNKEKYKEYDHNYYIKHKRPKSKIGQAELKIADLEAKLAEKEKEIAYLTKQVKKFNNEAQKYFEDAYCNDTIYQDKISFAVNQLGKVKERMKKGYHYGIYNQNLIEYIDNQIKQLKEIQGNE